MQVYWDSKKVAKIITDYLRSKQGETEITFIVTFDEYGISGHPNHIAVHKGVRKVFEEAEFQFDVLCLQTVNRCRKYIGYFDIYTVMPDTLNYFCLLPHHSWKALSIH